MAKGDSVIQSLLSMCICLSFRRRTLTQRENAHARAPAHKYTQVCGCLGVRRRRWHRAMNTTNDGRRRRKRQSCHDYLGDLKGQFGTGHCVYVPQNINYCYDSLTRACATKQASKRIGYSSSAIISVVLCD